MARLALGRAQLLGMLPLPNLSQGCAVKSLEGDTTSEALASECFSKVGYCAFFSLKSVAIPA